MNELATMRKIGALHPHSVRAFETDTAIAHESEDPLLSRTTTIEKRHVVAVIGSIDIVLGEIDR